MSRERDDTAAGRAGFVERRGLWTKEQESAAEKILRDLERGGLEVVRLSFPDLHGILRGKTIAVRSLPAALRNGVRFTTAPFVLDTAAAIVVNPFVPGGTSGRREIEGFGDVVCVPDPRTFRRLPWAAETGWMLGDLYLESGEPLPYAPRHVLRRALGELAAAGFEWIAGLEVEWTLGKLVDPMLGGDDAGALGTPPPAPLVHAAAHGYRFLSEAALDEVDDVLRAVRKNVLALGLPLRTIEDELGPGQIEMTFDPLGGLDAADAMTLFRSAVKQTCRRLGWHATFMCKPALPGAFPSGWHLHQSIADRESGESAFASRGGGAPLSETGLRFVGGLLRNAAASSVFATPTVNGYRRRRPFSLAPSRATWGVDDRSAMLRVHGAPGDPATHVENRLGEPAANPYLYMASQVVSGLAGLREQLDPGPPTEHSYVAEDRPELPRTLGEAIAALRADAFFRAAFGEPTIDLLLRLKDSEWKRFEAASGGAASADVTAWEQREYFELF